MDRRIWQRFDYWLFGTVVLLCVFGIVMIRSAVAGNAEIAGSPMRQTIFVGAGLVVLLITTVIDYRYWSALARPMYVVAVAALIGIYALGTALYGSARWFDTGVILIQPSEIAKIVLILVLANFFASNKDRPKDWMWLAKSFAMMAGIMIWIFLQPNLSTSIVMVVLWFSMLWISGLPLKFLPWMAGGVIVAGLGALPFLENYQLKRIVDFFFQDQNARHGNAFNVNQALITIGSGSWFGMGYGHGTQVQLRYLKVRHTDFIFSAMAEEFGFVGTVIVIGLIVFVILRCLRVARRAPDMFGALVCYGVATLLFFQTMVNVGVNLKVLPVTGLTLPFVSYGGSSLLSLILGIGLVESVAAHSETS
jgi:rod shape determining protein RodA